MADDRPDAAAPAPSTAFDRRVLRAAVAGMGHPPVTLELWDGERIEPRGASLALVRIRDRSVLRDFARTPDVAFGDAFSDGRVEVEGDLLEVVEGVFAAGSRSRGWFRTASRVLGWRPRGHGRRRARENVQHHYDLGNEFYAMWLDERMLYTCAYFPSAETTLEDAQLAKMDHVCRKLVLRPGERVVEAGCGWGALALHMAEHYGASVRAFNVSAEQIEYAREQARARGLEKQVEFVQEDYRAISGRWDAFVSIGMLEHVGRGHYRGLGRLIRRCLAPDGRGLLHFIGHVRPTPTAPWLERRIFPGSYMPSLAESLRVLEPFDLAVVDVENLRRHYARTLEHWLARFDRAADLIEGMYDARFVRMWRLYLVGSIAAFRTGSTQLWQVLFARRDDARLPWTRAHLYA